MHCERKDSRKKRAFYLSFSGSFELIGLVISFWKKYRIDLSELRIEIQIILVSSYLSMQLLKVKSKRYSGFRLQLKSRIFFRPKPIFRWTLSIDRHWPYAIPSMQKSSESLLEKLLMFDCVSPHWLEKWISLFPLRFLNRITLVVEF